MKDQEGCRIVAELSIHPLGEGTSVSRYVRSALEALRKAKGVRLMVNPMGTVIEAKSLSDMLAAVQAAHESVFREGARRVAFTLTVDDRRDRARRMEDKVAAVS
jgi:uncharacterized protein (TIGR00106 family)